MFSFGKQAAKGIVSKGLATLGVALIASLVSVGAHAFPPLNLVPGTPDILSNFITTSYVGDSNNGTLTASGFSSVITPPGAPAGNIAGGTFDINASIQENALTASGSLSIGGTIAGLGFNSGTLLTGTMSAFGAGPGDPLEFLFSVTGGDAAALYGGIGAQAGVILSNSGYSGSFAQNFTGGAFQSLADTFGPANGVPLPGTLVLMLSGCLYLLRRRASATA